MRVRDAHDPVVDSNYQSLLKSEKFRVVGGTHQRCASARGAHHSLQHRGDRVQFVSRVDDLCGV